MCASYGARWRARGDHSPRATRRQPLRSFYITERTARVRVCGCHCSSSLALALRLWFETRLVQPALCFRLSRGSVLVSAGALLSLLSSLVCSRSRLWSLLCSRLFTLSTLLPSLFCFCLISASTTLSLVVCDFYCKLAPRLLVKNFDVKIIINLKY